MPCANGAEDILLPERYDGNEQALIDRIIENRKRGKNHTILINAEGIGHSGSMARRIEAATGIGQGQGRGAVEEDDIELFFHIGDVVA